MIEVKEIRKISNQEKKSQLIDLLLEENPKLFKLYQISKNQADFIKNIKNWVLEHLEDRPEAYLYYKKSSKTYYDELLWEEFAMIRILDYIDYSGRIYTDQNQRGKKVETNPFKVLWHDIMHEHKIGSGDFYEDMIMLFRQFSGRHNLKKPSVNQVKKWMNQYPTGLDTEITKLHEANRDRILKIIINKIDNGEISDAKYYFENEISFDEKLKTARKWWNESRFHLRFAVRTPHDLNEMLGSSLEPKLMNVLHQAHAAGIPFFINPYYLSLMLVDAYEYIGADQAIRDYIIYTKELINEFGHIVAWEKEDIVEPGKPNAAGCLLPSEHNMHRRYPEVAILIPDTVGRACGGLCSSCQRMYDFQSGHLNFDLKKLHPKSTWNEKLKNLMQYFESDAQLRDILITGGDALMSSNKSLKNILDEVYNMALRKREGNKNRKDGQKYAEMVRVRLGTRLLAYLPQRVTPELTKILAEFKEKASKIGIKQFVIQTHFESPLEVTPASKLAVERLNAAGWIVTNQLVFTAAASRRGHTAKLRKVLNDIGVLPYYTFSVKGFMENSHNFATNARSVQEQLEEKAIGKIEHEYYDTIKQFPLDAEHLVENINKLRNETGLPFLATDRNVLNMPGVGKSITFRTIGITNDGRRILEFEHDSTRTHSPVIEKMGRVVIIESKSMAKYMRQLCNMGEDVNEYDSVYGYSTGQTEERIPVYEYPDYEFTTTNELTNFEIH